MQGTEENRADVWLSEFSATLKDLAMSNLVAGGASLASPVTTGRRRIRSVQTRRIDGYSAEKETADTVYDYPSV